MEGLLSSFWEFLLAPLMVGLSVAYYVYWLNRK